MLSNVRTMEEAILLFGPILVGVITIFIMKWKLAKPFPSFVYRLKGTFLLGNLKDFHPDVVLKTLKEYPLKYGKFIEFYVGGRRTLMVTDPSMAKEVLLKHGRFLRGIRELPPILSWMNMKFPFDELGLSYSLPFLMGDEWLRVRKSVTTSFKRTHVAKVYTLIVGEIIHWMERVKEKCSESNGKCTLDMKYEAFSLTIRVITSFAFGIPSDTADEKEKELSRYFFSKEFRDDMLKIFTYLRSSLITGGSMQSLFKTSPLLDEIKRQALAGNETFSKHSLEVINYRRQLLESMDKPHQHEGEHSQEAKEKNLSIIDEELLACKHGHLTENEVVSNAKIFFLAGSDSTSISISWAVYYLCLFPHFQRVIREEAHEILCSDLSTADNAVLLQSIDFGKVQKMKFASSFVKETLRLRGPASSPGFGFTPIEHSVTFSNGITIEPGEAIMVNREGMHYSPEIFPNPEQFDPFRWINVEDHHLEKMNAAYMPFGGGSRVCPGMPLSYQETILALSFLCSFFEMSLDCPVEDVKRIAYLLLAAPNHVPVIFKSLA